MSIQGYAYSVGKTKTKKPVKKCQECHWYAGKCQVPVRAKNVLCGFSPQVVEREIETACSKFVAEEKP